MQKSGELIKKSRETIEKNRNRPGIDAEITVSIEKSGELMEKYAETMQNALGLYRKNPDAAVWRIEAEKWGIDREKRRIDQEIRRNNREKQKSPGN
ncbi:hypothetical protein [Salibacterium qingdaonense]|uniref:Uncharacterized protein n=1 Tax=Salibacterium qingdaonense TaxID=266892 RepID=A0A1I4PN36_9BACI|nr:hypothetical protein [Salibacterium qingdaonense]SFM29331.1 hypothetical protein SAMN04488054_12926 [Salibacterium qingdaonense]